jgi:hypothetical protein
MEDTASALVVLRSVSSKYFGVEVPPLIQGQVRVDLHIGCINIERRSATETHLSLIIRSDPHLMMIPTWLMNFGIKHFIYYFMDRIREKAQQYPGSEHEQRVNSKPEYYGAIQARMQP